MVAQLSRGRSREELSERDPQGIFMSVAWIWDIPGRPTVFLRMWQNHHQLGLKGTETGRNERRLSDFQNSTSRK